MAAANGPRTDIAVVGWAQTPMIRRTDLSETQLLLRVITDALEPLGLTRADIDFTCLGSCDYITGQAFSFVSNLDAIGAWPPKRDSHVEMDGAWALYEAWLRLQEGDIEIAVVTGSGRSSTGDPALIYPMEMDPFYLAPLGVDPLTFAALQARSLIAAGVADERAMAEVAARSRRDALDNPDAQVKGDADVDTLLASRVRARATAPPRPPTDHRRRRGDGARHRRPRPHAARAPRVHHRLRSPDRVPQPGVPRPHRLAVDPHRGGGRRARRRTGRGRGAAGRVQPRGDPAAPGPRARRRRRGEPIRWRTRGQPDHGDRARPHRVRGQSRVRRREAGAGPLDVGPVPATEPRLHPGGRRVSAEPCAIVGVGQTHHKSRRHDVSFGGLVREAVFRALDDAQMSLGDIDAVVIGKAPDLFEGVMKPELYLSDALGAVGKPMFRVHTAGSVGGTTAIVAASHVQARKHERVLAVAFEKQSEGNAQFALGSGRGASLGAGGAFAPFIRAYISRSGAPEHIGWKVAVKDRQNALEEPVRAPADRGHLHREGEGVPHAVGTAPLPGVVPVVGRRLRGRAHERSRWQRSRGGRSPAGMDPRRVLAQRAAELPGPRPGPPRRVRAGRVGRLRAGRHHEPSRSDRRGRALRAVLVARGDLAGGPRHRGTRRRAGR